MNITFFKNNINFNLQNKSALYSDNVQKKPKASILPSFDYFNAIKSYNIPFLGKKASISSTKPIYVIDAFKNYKRYESVQDASLELKMEDKKILQCARGDIEFLNGLMFAYADNIEESTRSGKKPDSLMISLSAEVLNSIDGFKYPLPTIEEAIRGEIGEKSKRFLDKQAPAKKGPIYAICKDGSYEKFEKSKIAAQTLSVSPSTISLCLNNKINSSGNYTYCFASDIEVEGENGEFILSEDLLKKRLELFNMPNGTTPPVVAQETIEKETKEKQKVDENGHIDILSIQDEDIEGVPARYLQSPFYMMDETLNYRKFYRQSYVASAIGVDKTSISKCILGKSKLLKGFAFAPADKVEKVDENGNQVLDLTILENKFKKKDGFYSIDKLGNYQKFESAKEAVEALGVSYACVLHCLLGKQKVTSDYVFIRACDIEKENEDGTISVDKEKIEDKKAQITESALYLIDKYGDFKRYNTPTEAAEKIGATRSQVSACLSGARKTVHGYAAVSANEVEKYRENGVLTIDGNKLKQVLASSREQDVLDVSENGGIYAIDKNGNCKKFPSIKKAQKELNIQGSSISGCLKGRYASAGGYVYVLADEIETVDENGEIVLNQAKIAQKISIFEGKSVYAIDKNGNCYRFSSQKEASKALGISIKSISGCITGKSNMAANYAFVLADEIETVDENGEITINDKLVQEKASYLTKFALYAVDKDGNYRKFDDRVQAVATLKVDKANLAACLSGKAKTAKGYAFISAQEVEKKGEDGTIVVDEEKIKTLLEKFQKRSSKN